MAIEYQIDQSEFQATLQAITEASAEGIEKEIKVDWQRLQAEANKFINAYESLEKEKDSYTKTALKQAILANPKSAGQLLLMNNRISKETYILRSQYLLAFKFEEYLDKFRGNQLPRQAAYVIGGPDISTKTFIISLQELALRATGEGKIAIKVGGLQKLHKALEDTQNDEDLQKHIEEAQAALNGITNRLQRFYEVTNKSGSTAQGGILLWKEGRQWAYGRVSNYGDVKEAYVNFLFQEHENDLCKINEGSPQYYSHSFIGTFFDNYINQVTNKAAILEEDIQGKNTQYSVKSFKSELPSLNQYLTTARWIIQQKNIFSKNEIEQFLNKEFSQDAKRNIRLTYDEVAQKIGEEVITKMQNMIK